jgi:hypothetical protein
VRLVRVGRVAGRNDGGFVATGRVVPTSIVILLLVSRIFFCSLVLRVSLVLVSPRRVSLILLIPAFLLLVRVLLMLV